MGRRLAEVAFPLAHRMSQRKIEAAVRKRISARVRLPRAQSSMKIEFMIDLAPLGGVAKMCEDAGLQLTEGPRGRRAARPSA
eukprot:6262669-Prymnesium_polylepis.1